MRKSIQSKFLVSLMVLLLSLVIVGCNDKGGTVEKTKFTVIFDVNAGDDIVQNEPDTVRVDENTAVSKPTPDPIRSGYDFQGWFTNPDGTGSPYEFSTPVSKNNFVLFAVWSVTVEYHTVTFDYNYDNITTDLSVPDGDSFDAPVTPERAGFRFDGWFVDQAFTSAYNFESTVDSAFSIYAKWVTIFEVSFDLNYDNAPTIETQIIDENGQAVEPTVPDREGYTFAGWFTDVELSNSYDFSSVTESLTLYAKWNEVTTNITYNVTFDYNYEGSPDSVLKVIPEGGVASITQPVRANYRFLGWFTDNEVFENKFNLSTPINSDLVLYANWVKTVELTVDYNYQGAINPSPLVVDEATSISIQTPSRVGYTFAGWSNQANGLIGYDLSAGISANETIYAQWQKVNVFEAEYLDFTDFFGWGFSGNATGTDAIVEDTTGTAGVSNGRFVTYLYGNGITLEYEIYSDRTVEDVTLTLRLSGEVKDFYLQALKTPGVLEEEPVYTIKVNGETIIYSDMYFIGVPSQSSNTIMPFQDYVISVDVTLVEGLNTIQLITDNELLMGGTMSATAPMIDCLKLTTYAVLTWTPKLDNY